ncbi:protein FAM210A-like [Diadema setosum]|uniref:protein FAM210A-like n=1 Tax=Diadema setosum TaxID=31175 RepID=UPI003B3B7B75
MAFSHSVRRICCAPGRLAPHLKAAHFPSGRPPVLCCTILPRSPHALPRPGKALGLAPGGSNIHVCHKSFFSRWSASSTQAKEQATSSATLKDTGSREASAEGSSEMKTEAEVDEDESIIPTTDEKGQPLSNWSRMKIMMKTYGYVIIPVHWVIAPIWFGAFYYTIKMGVDIGPFLSAVGVSDHHVESLRNSKASTALMAYALYKIFTPLRYTVTLGATEMTIRRLRKMGYIRPHPPKEKSYRDSFRETVTEMRDKIKERQDSAGQ